MTPTEPGGPGGEPPAPDPQLESHRYARDREIGRGEMGVVYLARDLRLDRELALKVLTMPPGLSSDVADEFRHRFVREAKAAASLSHPGIVTVHDAGEENGELFIAMEYVRGETLRHRIQVRGTLDLPEAVTIVRGLARALDAAHEKGIVHRDIKPANILLRQEDGAPKIADFGIACLPGSDLTRHGSSPGSPAYMAPELIAGGPARPESDLFSLAVILYECLCGRRPFAGDSLAALTWAIRTVSPAPIGGAGLPRALDAFFARALAKDPARRFPSGARFEEALVAATQGAMSAPPPTRPWKVNLQSATVLALSVLLFGALVVVVVRDQMAPDLASAAGPEPAARIPAAAPIGRGAAARDRGRMPAAPARPAAKSSLQLRIKNSFPEGTLSVMVNGATVYTCRLTAPRKSGPFSRRSERIDAAVAIPAGRLTITARVRTSGKDAYEEGIQLESKTGQTREVRIVSGRTPGSPLTIKAD